MGYAIAGDSIGAKVLFFDIYIDGLGEKLF